MTKLVTGQSIGLNQPEPPEGRKAIIFPPFEFDDGTESYYWDTKKLGNQKVSSIVGAWIDVSYLITGGTSALTFDELLVIIGGQQNGTIPVSASEAIAYAGNQIIRVNNPKAGGFAPYNIPKEGEPQGFYLFPSQVPFSMLVGWNGATAGHPQVASFASIILYNYNPLLTGFGIVPPNVIKSTAEKA